MTFDLGYDGASPPEKIEIEDGSVLSPVEDPARDGYQFDGWYTADGTLYAFKTPVTESFTLTARWTIESSGGSGGGSVPTDKELLEGQWAVYYQSPSDSSGDFQPYEYLLIDIQHTLSEYWIIVYTDEDPVIGAPVKSDRTETEDGWFVVSLDFLDPEAEMKYRFVDDERNTLEAEFSMEGTTAGKFRLERISSEKEIELHIVSFQLDDSISSDDGYVLSSELIAVESGRSLGNSLLTLEKQDGTEVPALFTTADGTAFTEDTPVNGDITVTVTPPGVIGSTHYVSTEDGLLDWADALTNNTSLNCVLLADITLTEDWSPVCIGGYAGTFDGRGHKISNLKLKAPGSNFGLFFGILENAVVKNLTVEVPNTDMRSYGNVGAVVGNNNGTIENCHSIINAGVSESFNFGGIAATNGGIIKGCSSRIGGQISDSTNIGGIAGTNNGTIAASFMVLEETGSLSSSGSVYCAGIAGYNTTGSVTGCYSVINGKISNNQSESYAIALGGDCTACYWQSADESFEDDTSGAEKVTTAEGWGEVMGTMNDAIENMGYQFQKNEGTDGTIPLIIVPFST